jgi:hypothetical protein
VIATTFFESALGVRNVEVGISRSTSCRILTLLGALVAGQVHGHPTPSNNILRMRGVTFWGNSSHSSLKTLTKQLVTAPIRIPQRQRDPDWNTCYFVNSRAHASNPARISFT